MNWQLKRMTRRDCELLVTYVYGPVIGGEYHFHINAEDGALKSEIFNSINAHIDQMKTFKIAQETASFATSELLKIVTQGFKGKEVYFREVSELTPIINKKLKTFK